MLTRRGAPRVVRRLGALTVGRRHLRAPPTTDASSTARGALRGPSTARGPVLDPSVVERVLETDGTPGWLSEQRFSADCGLGPSQLPSEVQRDMGTHRGTAAQRLRGTTHSRSGSGASDAFLVDSTWTLQRAEALLAKYRKWHQAASVSPLATSTTADMAMTDQELDDIRGCLDFSLRCEGSQCAALLHEAAQLAYVAGFHRRCLDLFLRDHKTAPELERVPLHRVGKPAADATSPRSDVDGVVLPSYVLLAALQCDDSASFARVARIVLTSYAGRDDTTVLDHTRGTPHHVQTREGLYEVQVMRLYAHCVCALARHAREGTDAFVDPVPPHHSPRRDPSHLASTSDVFVATVAQVARECASRLLAAAEPSASVDAFVAHSRRRALYASGRDGAVNAAIFLQVFQAWAATAEQPSAAATTGRVWLTASLLSTVLRSSLAERRWDHMEYYSLYLDAFFHSQVTQGRTNLTRQEDGLVLVFTRYAAHTRQWTRCRDWLTHITRQFPDYLPSLDVANQAARVAMATPDARLATWALETVLAAGQLTAPSSADVLVCLSAVARCGLGTFADVLRSCIDSGLVQLTEEELLYVQLLHCRRSVRWREEVEALISVFHLQQSGDPRSSASSSSTLSPSASLSSRNLYQLLLILQEGEHPDFMVYYRLFLTTFAAQMNLEERARWAIFALAWATLRCGSADVEDVLYTAQEVLQLWCVDGGNARNQNSARLLPDTRRSLMAKWGVLQSQHAATWWQQQLTLPSTAVGTHAASTADMSAGNLVARFLSSASQSSSLVVAPTAARFLKRPSLVQLGGIHL